MFQLLFHQARLAMIRDHFYDSSSQIFYPRSVCKGHSFPILLFIFVQEFALEIPRCRFLDLDLIEMVSSVGKIYHSLAQDRRIASLN